MDLDQSVYLDHAGATPVRREVLDKMLPILCNFTAGSQGSHAHARRAGVLIEEARRAVGDCLGVESDRVRFCESGSRAAEQAVLGLARARGRGHILTSLDEDQGVLSACRALESQGFRVTYLTPREDGFLAPDLVAGAIESDTILLSLAAVNRWTGRRQPLEQLSALCRSRGVNLHLEASLGCLFEFDLEQIDLLSLSSHLIGGPNGAGVVWSREALDTGSYLESDNLANIVGFAQALCYLTDERSDWVATLRGLRSELERLLGDQLPPGRECSGEFHPGILSLRFEGVNTRELVYQLDRWGVCALETGYGVRFSLSRTTTREDLARAASALASALRSCRQLAGEAAA